jgi:iron complex transport system substrate-binding protein
VVSLNPALTETIVALGGAEQLVGIGQFDPAVPGRDDLPRLGDAFTVSLEALAALGPDLVLVNGASLAERLSPLTGAARVEVVRTDTLDDVLASARTVGTLLGRVEAGGLLARRLEQAFPAARERAARRARSGAPAPTVLVVLQHAPLYVAGRGSYVHELLELVGAIDVAGDLDAAWPTLSEEALVQRAPDVILDASGGVEQGLDAPAVLARWRAYPTLPAVRNRRVVVIASDALFRPGPRLVDAVEELEHWVHDRADQERGDDTK